MHNKLIDQTELEIPELINDNWLNSFNAKYSSGEFLAKLLVEEWLEQPEDMQVDTRDFTLENIQNSAPPRNWKQSIIGRVVKAEFTHTPKVGGEPKGYGLFLAPAFIESKYDRDLIADGRLILIRFDNILESSLVLLKDDIESETKAVTIPITNLELKQVA